MRQCETCGRPTEGDWSAFYGFHPNEHGVTCQACGLEYFNGIRDRKERRKEDSGIFDVPIYPSDQEDGVEKKPRAKQTAINHVVQATTVSPVQLSDETTVVEQTEDKHE